MMVKNNHNDNNNDKTNSHGYAHVYHCHSLRPIVTIANSGLWWDIPHLLLHHKSCVLGSLKGKNMQEHEIYFGEYDTCSFI